MNQGAGPLGRHKSALTNNDLLDIHDSFEADDVVLGSPLKLFNKMDLEDNNPAGTEWAIGSKPASSNCQLPANLLLQKEEEDELVPLPAFNSKRKTDSRRQSTAIFSAFELTTCDTGLLGDSELAVGVDEDILIPLAKSSSALAAKGTSSLWVDPDTDELMDEELPELTTVESSTDDGNAGGGGMGGSNGRGACERGGGVRDSAALFAGFSRVCEKSGGLASLDSSMESVENAILCDGGEATFPGFARAEQQRSSSVDVRDSAALLAGFSRACFSSPGLDAVREDEDGLPASFPLPSAAASVKPSRLRPPSSSSSFFKMTQTIGTAGAGGRAAAGSKPLATGKTTARAETASFKQTRSATNRALIPRGPAAAGSKPMATGRAMATGRVTATTETASFKQTRQAADRAPIPRGPAAVVAAPVRKEAPRPGVPPPQPQPAAPAVDKTLPAASRLLPPSRLPRSRLPAPKAPSPLPPQGAPAAAAADVTPRSAHLRWLEEHPELAFGGGSKIRMESSPAVDEPMRKSAIDAHYDAWGDSITALNDKKQ